MTLLGKLARTIDATPGDLQGLGNPDSNRWLDQFYSSRSSTGKTVTVETALGIPAVWSCMRVLTDTIGSMPLVTYERMTGGGQREAFSQPIYRLLRDRPNPEMTGTLLWRQVMFHLNGWGNSFIGKDFADGVLANLWPIRPDRVIVERKGGRKLFWVKDDNGAIRSKPYTSADIIHIQGISFDGLIGLSPIEVAREAMGLGLALDEYTNRFFSNGAIPRVALQKKEGALSGDAAARLAADWKSRYGSTRNAHSTAVLEEGLEVKILSFPLKDLQFVEQMQWTAGDVARLFRVPPSKIGISAGDSMTYKSVESDTIDFLTFSMLGWTTLIEQALAADDDLFPRRANSRSMFPQFFTGELLRADLSTQGEYFTKATGGRRWMKPSEVRRRSGLSDDTTLDDEPAPAPAPPAPPKPADA